VKYRQCFEEIGKKIGGFRRPYLCVEITFSFFFRLMKDLEELRKAKSEAIAREQLAQMKGKRDVERIKCRMEKLLESERKAKSQIQNSLTYTRLQLEEQIEERVHTTNMIRVNSN